MKHLKKKKESSDEYTFQTSENFIKDLTESLNKYATEFCKERGVDLDPPKVMSESEGKKIYNLDDFYENSTAIYYDEYNLILYSDKLKGQFGSGDDNRIKSMIAFLQENTFDEAYKDKDFIKFTFAHEFGHAVDLQLLKEGYENINSQVSYYKIDNSRLSDKLSFDLLENKEVKVGGYPSINGEGPNSSKVPMSLEYDYFNKRYRDEGIANLIGAYLFLNLEGVDKPSSDGLYSILINGNLNQYYTYNHYHYIKRGIKDIRRAAKNLGLYTKNPQSIDNKSKDSLDKKFEDSSPLELSELKNSIHDTKSDLVDTLNLKLYYTSPILDIARSLKQGKSIDDILRSISKKLDGEYYNLSSRAAKSESYDNIKNYDTDSYYDINILKGFERDSLELNRYIKEIEIKEKRLSR